MLRFQVLLNSRANKNQAGVYATSSGDELAADLVYRTVGGSPNTGFLKGSHIPLDARGFIKASNLAFRV